MNPEKIEEREGCSLLLAADSTGNLGVAWKGLSVHAAVLVRYSGGLEAGGHMRKCRDAL